MKCPYREFQNCIIEQCPSCNYEEIKSEIVCGRYPMWMSTEEAVKNGLAWKETKTTYKFVSCKLIDNNVQPAPVNKQIVNNTASSSITVVKRSIF